AHSVSSPFTHGPYGSRLYVLMRLPHFPPFLLVAQFVGGKDPPVFVPGELKERRPTDMVNEDISRADHPIALLPYPSGVIIVLEHADLEAFIEQANLVDQGTSQAETKRRQDFNLKVFSLMSSRVRGRRLRHPRQIAVV